MSFNSGGRGPRSTPPGGDPYTDETRVMRRGRPEVHNAVGRPPQPSRWARLRLALLLGLGLLLLLLGLLYWQVIRLAHAVGSDDARHNAPIASPMFGANLLLIGTDERSGHPAEGVRGDTLILVRLDPLGGWVSLLSIPRDSEVSIPRLGLDQTKINVAYGQGYAAAEALYGPQTTPQQGGMALAAETVAQFLNLEQRGQAVDFVAVINFAGFKQIIDALGGIMIDVPTLIVDDEYPTDDFGVMRVEFQPGLQRMDGTTALIYARTRHQDSDFGRAERQQQVLRAILHAIQDRGPLGQALTLPALASALDGSAEQARPLVTTMPLARPDVLLAMLILAGNIDPATLGQFRLGPEQLAYENGSNLIFDPPAVQALLDTWQHPPSEAAEQALVQVFNGTEMDGLARTVSLKLETERFRMLPPANAPFPVERTLVYDQGGAPATAARLARLLEAELVRGPPPAELVSDATIVVLLGPEARE